MKIKTRDNNELQVVSSWVNSIYFANQVPGMRDVCLRASKEEARSN